MTLYWPPEKTFEYELKEKDELTLVIPLEMNNKKKANSKKGDMEK